MQQINVEIFTDVLCIWAYGAQARFDQLRRDFGDKIDLHYRFIPLFAATQKKITEGWKDRGGAAGFNAHCLDVSSRWDHVSVHKDLWLGDMPASSNNPHLYIKAAQILQARGDISANAREAHGGASLIEEFIWHVRCHFFERNGNISQMAVLDEIASALGLPVTGIHEQIDCGRASAALHLDLEARDAYQVPGSPTLVFNQGRQRLYGNVGYRIIQANIQELLSDRHSGGASWC